MNQVVAHCDLELVVCFVEVLIQHLNKGFLGVELPLVILRVDVDIVAEFFGFGDPHDLAPISEKLLAIEVDDFLLVADFRSKDIFFHFR